MKKLFHRGPKPLRPEGMLKLLTLGYLLGEVSFKHVNARLLDKECDVEELREEYYTLIDMFLAPYIHPRKPIDDSSDDSSDSSEE